MNLGSARLADPRRRSLPLAAVGVTAWATLIALDGGAIREPAMDLPWWWFAVAFLASDLAAVHVRAGGSTWAVRLNGVPLVLALFYLSPLELLAARGVGSALVVAWSIVTRHRTRERVHEALVLVSACGLAAVTFRAVAALGEPTGATGWVAAFAASIVSLAVAGRFGSISPHAPRGSRRIPLTLAGASIFETSLALLAVDHLGKDGNDLWLIALAVTVLWAAVRILAREQHQQELLGLLFEQSVFGVVLIDPRLRVRDVNETACGLVGVAKRDLVGRPFASYVDPADRANAMEGARAILSGERATRTSEIRVRAAAGRILTMNATSWAVRDPDERIGACLTVLQDVTAERDAQERGRRREDRVRGGLLQMTLAREPDAVLQAVVDLAREVVQAEHAAIDVEGPNGARRYVASRTDRETWAPTLRSVTRSDDADVRSSSLGVPIVFKGTVLGNLSIENKAGAAEFDAEDEIVLQGLAAQAAVIVENATMHAKEQRLIERLDRSNAELTSASRARSLFIATMSHDLRTPLNAMLLSADILRDPAFSVSEERARELARNIATSGRHLLGLIDDLLDLSRIEAGRFDVRPEPVSIGRVIDDAVEATERTAAEKAIELRAPECGDLWVDADPTRTHQVLVNLLSNAIKYTDPGGRVWIDVDREADVLAIAVCDTGKGIAPGDLDRIFEPFEQADRYAVGTGLGLAISRAIAEAHGGALTVTSRVGVGSRFVLTLPAAVRPPAVLPIQPTLDEQEPDERLSVLIVEDDASALALCKEILRSASFDVVGGSTVEEALAEIRRRRPDVLLADVRLGHQNGLDVVRALRATDDPTARTPAIAVSASASKRDVQCALDAGCDSFLAKPLTSASLVTGVRSVLAGRERPGPLEGPVDVPVG